ncbi:MAG: hypothetical protein ACEQR8_07865 [Cypionkella sp.]
MDEAMTMPAHGPPLEARLREALARSDAAHAAIGPILRHLLSDHDEALFTDEIAARVRGMIRHLAQQFAAATARGPDEREIDALAADLARDEALVRHCHACALEGQLSARLEQRSAIDPVLSPLLQALIASDDAAVAATAMAALAAQARFVQQQRRMELPLGELPADRFDRVVSEGARFFADGDSAAALRAGYDEAATRIALFARLVEGMGAGARAALSLPHAGLALFLAGTAVAARQDRDLVVVAASEVQPVRLALALRAAALNPGEVAEQVALVQPDAALPDGFATLGAEQAAALLTGRASGRR